MNVRDETNYTVFEVFDQDGQYLLKKSCADMVTKLQKFRSGMNYPTAFIGLLGKKLLFKVEMKSDPIPHFDGSYCVTRVCDDDTILSMFQLDGAEITPEKDFMSQA